MDIFDEALKAALAAHPDDFRAALKVAAPILMAEAWDEGAEAVTDDDGPEARATNPYYV